MPELLAVQQNLVEHQNAVDVREGSEHFRQVEHQHAVDVREGSEHFRQIAEVAVAVAEASADRVTKHQRKDPEDFPLAENAEAAIA